MRRLLLMLVVTVLAATMMVCSSAPPALAQNDPDDGEDIEIFCGPISEPEDADSEAYYPGEEFACVAIPKTRTRS
jgi:hypothetical protein